MRDALGDFLPRGRFLGLQKFRQVVDYDYESGIRLAWAQRADGHRRPHELSARRNFDFSRRCAHPQRPPHQMRHRFRRIVAEQFRERLRVARVFAENLDQSAIDARHFAGLAQGHDARGNVFENGLHQLAPPLAFLDGLFQTAREIVDLLAAFAELFRHAIERANERPQFILRLHFDPVVEIAARNFARALGERLNWHSDLLRKK